MTDQPVVAVRETLDGVTVYLHADGSLSTHTHYLYGGKLPEATMWRLIDDVCLYMFEELRGFLCQARLGNIPPKPRPTMEDSLRAMSANSKQRMLDHSLQITHNRKVRYVR